MGLKFRSLQDQYVLLTTEPRFQPLLKLVFFIVFLVCVCVYFVCVCVHTHGMSKSEDRWESVLVFYLVRSWDQTQIIRLGSKRLYRLSHLFGHKEMFRILLVTVCNSSFL